MIRLNDFFDKVFCITCFEDKSRQDKCKEQFEKYNINFQWVISTNKLHLIANKISTGEFSLFLSHIRCIEESKLNGYKTIAIFEDDFVLYDNWEYRFNLFVSQLPYDWELLYLGEPEYIKFVYPTDEQQFKEYCSLCKYGSTSVFMGVSEKIYDYCLNINFDKPIDLYYHDIMLRGKSYTPANKRLCSAISMPHERFFDKIPNFNVSNYIPSKLRDIAINP